MPRSPNNWPSRRRQEYIDWHLSEHGWINREAICEFFGVEKSTASLDISAYPANCHLRKAKAGETVGGEVVKGYKLGGRLMYVPTEAWKSVAPVKHGWRYLPSGNTSHVDWLADVVAAYIADNGAEGAAAYFGVSQGEIDRADPLWCYCADRDRVWESFK